LNLEICDNEEIIPAFTNSLYLLTSNVAIIYRSELDVSSNYAILYK
ncbi:33012_t:CDS:1, partial [Gigaspora margarita]